ncbi:NAD(P)/FAD-dependent oxidoreductase [uncultured Tateyamaria sp.]|nr:NAD(P)/FAD-dependent oxidoreductase [uncultured Tateyamaria sp.]
MTTANILIVGTGPSGLVALKEMQEAGLDAIAVDSRSSFGGVFAPDSGVTFENLHLTISSIFMSFSDFPAPDVDKGVKYWSQDEYFDYLTRYVEHFGLKQHMQLETTVENAHLNRQTGKWEVRLTNHSYPGEPRTTDKIFDKLIVATGANNKPKIPEELMQFKGEILHSTDYRSAEQVRGKKVLVVGMGEGSADVASSAAETAANVTVWGRRYPDCAPRFVEPFLNDAKYDEYKHMAQHYKPNGVLESITITRAVRNLPLGLWSVALQGLVSDVRKKHGPNSVQGLSRALTARAWESDYYSSDTSMVPTKSAITLTAAAKGLLDIVIAPEISIENNMLTLRDASLFQATEVPNEQEAYDLDVDVIVACTGFDLAFDWISCSEGDGVLNTNPRTWFKHCFPAGMGEHLAFVGFARPHSGGIPQCAEMVSRYIAQLHIGNLKLPTDYDQLASSDAAAERTCFHLTPEYNVLVDYMAYMMSVAKLIGCTPKAVPRLTKPLDVVKYWTFPLWPCFFRTQGVGAKPDAAENVLSKFGPFDALTPMPLLALQLLCGIVMPFINGSSWLVNLLMPRKNMGRALPRLYKWRMSKMYFMYHNSLTLKDFTTVFTQWLAVMLIIGYLITKSISSVILPKRKLRPAAE